MTNNHIALTPSPFPTHSLTPLIPLTNSITPLAHSTHSLTPLAHWFTPYAPEQRYLQVYLFLLRIVTSDIERTQCIEEDRSFGWSWRRLLVFISTSNSASRFIIQNKILDSGIVEVELFSRTLPWAFFEFLVGIYSSFDGHASGSSDSNNSTSIVVSSPWNSSPTVLVAMIVIEGPSPPFACWK